MSPTETVDPVGIKLRFSEFTGNWVKNELTDLASIQRGRFSPRPRNNPIYYGGNIPFVQTSDVVNSGGRIYRFTQTLNEKGLEVSKLFPQGTILITIAANIGYTGVLQIDMACPDSLVGISCNPEVHNYFLHYLLQKEQPKMEYLAVEAAQKNINIGFLEAYALTLPTLPEQRKIADFLTSVDKRIQQLTEKKALLEDYNKGVMQQLFTQAIRFKDDHGNDFPDWEEKKLGEVLTIGSGKDYKHLNAGTIPVYGSGGVMTYVDDKLYEGESVCIGRKGTIDNPLLVSGAFWTVDTLFFTHSFRDALPRFVYAIFQQINWRKYNEASGVPSLSKATIEKIPVPMPHPEEQTKIASFLSAIDRKIECVTTQIADTQTFKRGLLQQMFV